MDIERRLATRMRALRLQKGWSQEELGHQAEIHRTFVSQLERVTRTPTIVTVEKIANALGVKIGDLLDE